MAVLPVLNRLYKTSDETCFPEFCIIQSIDACLGVNHITPEGTDNRCLHGHGLLVIYFYSLNSSYHQTLLTLVVNCYATLQSYALHLSHHGNNCGISHQELPPSIRPTHQRTANLRIHHGGCTTTKRQRRFRPLRTRRRFHGFISK